MTETDARTKTKSNASESSDPKKIVERIQQELARLDGERATEKEVIRERVLSLVRLSKGTRQLSRYHISSVTTAKAARAKILAYLKLFVKQAITADELAAVSGIKEYGRRIRELRVEHGYKISTGVSREDLKPTEYVLEDLAPNLEEAEKWQVANKIRKRKGSGESRILELLKHYVGRVLTGEQLFYVAKIPSFRRRTEEIRSRGGWRVATRLTGRPDLKSSEYVLETLEQVAPHDRKIKDEVYSDVLKRDGDSCRGCNWNIKKRVKGERKQFIEVHHIEHHQKGGTNNEENLVTLCNVCHDVVHAKDVQGSEFWSWLEQRQSKTKQLEMKQSSE